MFVSHSSSAVMSIMWALCKYQLIVCDTFQVQNWRYIKFVTAWLGVKYIIQQKLSNLSDFSFKFLVQLNQTACGITVIAVF